LVRDPVLILEGAPKTETAKFSGDFDSSEVISGDDFDAEADVLPCKDGVPFKGEGK
jgi:hypothetical protein